MIRGRSWESCSGLAVALALASLLADSRCEAQQTAGSQAVQPHQSESFNLRTGTNLVVVRVQVVDADGRAVENLGREDFKLFDNGKEQTIAQFEMKTLAAEKSLNRASAPLHFVALFFDDVDTPLDYLTSARAAADQFLAADLQPWDRAALITTSGANMVEFTSDLKRLHEALFNIAPNEHGGDPRMQSWRNLQTLDQLVVRLSQMPGQRSIILISPGFMSATQQAHVDGIIERALHSQVVVSTINPRGLVPPASADLMSMAPETAPPTASLPAPPQTPGRGAPPSETPPSADFVDSLDPDLLIKPATVLQEIADGTGGKYFHDNNDLKGGLRELSGTDTAYYILAFHPKDLKPDGRFHSLKVSLRTKRVGFRLQARHGYFAPGPKNPTDDADDRIREALLAPTDVQQLPVVLGAGLSKTANDGREFSLLAHLDARPLRFHKEGEQNVNTVTFVFAIFDEDGVMVGLKQRSVRVSVLDAQLPDLFKAGVDAGMSFELKPGIYHIREVVTDSEEHRMTAFSKDVKIP